MLGDKWLNIQSSINWLENALMTMEQKKCQETHREKLCFKLFTHSKVSTRDKAL